MSSSDTDTALVQKADGTVADSSAAAASGATAEVQTRFIPFQTPGHQTAENVVPLVLTIQGNRFLEPPEHPVLMYKTYQLSAFWESILEALGTNVYKAPYVLKPKIRFDSVEEAEGIVREALLWQKSGGNFDAEVEVTDQEVTDTLEKLKRRATIEKHFIEKFFQEAVPDMTYRQLWELTGQDEEVTGNAYWEIIRDTLGNIARIQWLPATTMRCTTQGSQHIGAQKIVRDSVLGWTKEPQIRRFRRWAQLHGKEAVVTWFKEYGDPRVLSRKSGKFYSDLMAYDDNNQPIVDDNGQHVVVMTALQRMRVDEQDPQAFPATEVLHWRIPFGGSSVYGKPRATGAWPGMAGSRELDEENRRLVADEAIPSLMLLVSGGVVGSKSYDRFKERIEERKRGRKGIMVVEAISSQQVGVAAPQQQPKIAVERLKSEQNTDMLYQTYDKRNEEKVAGAYRMPRSALGKDIGQNRATVAAMQRYTEDQVYEPKRIDRDEVINEVLFGDLDILMWEYATRSQQTKDPQTVAEVLRVLVEAGIVTPNEARQHAGQPIFNKRLDDLKGLWTMFPPRVLTVLLQTKNQQLATALLGEDPTLLDKLAVSVRQSLGLDSTAATPAAATPPQQPPADAGAVKVTDGTHGSAARRQEATGGPAPGPNPDGLPSPKANA